MYLQLLIVKEQAHPRIIEIVHGTSAIGGVIKDLIEEEDLDDVALL